jgi:hypothetical protein
MSDKPSQDDPIRLFMIWTPRVLIGISIVLLIYLTQRTERFKGLLNDSFLAEENLNLVRGPFAKKEYYERGLLDYQASSLFPEEDKPLEEGPFSDNEPTKETAPVPQDATQEE